MLIAALEIFESSFLIVIHLLETQFQFRHVHAPRAVVDLDFRLDRFTDRETSLWQVEIILHRAHTYARNEETTERILVLVDDAILKETLWGALVSGFFY